MIELIDERRSVRNSGSWLQLWKYSNSDAFRLIIEIPFPIYCRRISPLSNYRDGRIAMGGESELVDGSTERGREGRFTLYERFVDSSANNTQ